MRKSEYMVEVIDFVEAAGEEISINPKVSVTKAVNNLLDKTLQNALNPTPQPTYSSTVMRIAQATEEKMINDYLNGGTKSSGGRYSVLDTAAEGFKAIQALMQNPDHPVCQKIKDFSLKDLLGVMQQNGNGTRNNQMDTEKVNQFILQLNPDDYDSIADYIKLSQKIGGNVSSNFSEARQSLLKDQYMLRKQYGIEEQQPQQQQQLQQQYQQQPQQPQQQPQQYQSQRPIQRQDINRQDINRQLIDQYVQNQDPFFNQNQPNINLSDTKQSPEEMILSLSPDDPVSIHQYAYLHNITNLDAQTIKKMLISEQTQLRKSIPQEQPPEFPTGDSWDAKDLNKPVSKPVTQEQDSKERLPAMSMSTILGTNEGDDGSTISRTEFEKEINMSQAQVQTESQPEQQQQPQSEIEKISMMLQKMGDNLEGGLLTMNQEIAVLKEEIAILKNNSSNSIKDAVATEITVTDDTTTHTIEAGTSSIPSMPASSPIAITESDMAGTVQSSIMPTTVTVPAPPLPSPETEKIVPSEPKEEANKQSEWWSQRKTVKDALGSDNNKQVKKFVVRRHLKSQEGKEESKEQSTEPVE